MSLTVDKLDNRLLRDVFGHFPSAVVAVCAMVDGERTGVAMSTFVPVSLQPPIVAVCVSSTSSTWPRLRTAPRLGISVLGEGHADTARALAAKTGDRFARLHTVDTPEGAVFIANTSVWLDTTLMGETSAGDHLMVTLAIDAVTLRGEQDPLIFHRSAFTRLHRD
ncbi:MAG: flavin reductase family protein [Actinobacteria bacterium]|nr:flavin reductase family protein [Actinomycetota bacterium]